MEMYAKCTLVERRGLWSSLEEVYHLDNGTWCIGGDFNAILIPDEQMEGSPHRMNESLEFNNCMNNCEVIDIGSGRILEHSCSRKLYMDSTTKVEDSQQETDSLWETKIQALEELEILHNNVQCKEDLNRGQEEYVKWMGIQENLLKQKAKTKCFEQGDFKTKYFHSLIRERRKRLQVYRIKDHRDNWFQGAEVLSRLLNNLKNNQNFTPFSINSSNFIINHLAYAGDIIIFTGGNSKSVKLWKQTLPK
ncbi:hypothetical protein RDI58_019777 [Solanum bulbocastanum]|uniref:Reverse transcriptase n=1 Tax=Solanum bulbocastanum TaxID=147425 RepID=A0AAN8TAV3_SOLBU